MLNSEKLSLRVMETYLSSAKLKSFLNQNIPAKYNAVHDYDFGYTNYCLSKAK